MVLTPRFTNCDIMPMALHRFVTIDVVRIFLIVLAIYGPRGEAMRALQMLLTVGLRCGLLSKQRPIVVLAP